MDILCLHYLWLQQAALCLRRKKECWVGLLHCFNSHLPSTETVTLLLFEDYMLNTIFMHVSLTCHHRKLWLVSFLFLPRPKCFSSFVGPPTPNTNTCAWSCESVATWQPSMCVNGDNRWCLERTVAASTARLHACYIGAWWEHKVMENEVGFLIRQRPLGKAHLCKASLTEFLLVIERKFVLYLRKTSH